MQYRPVRNDRHRQTSIYFCHVGGRCARLRRAGGNRVIWPATGATIAVEKLAPIEDFINGEVAAGRIPGAAVLVQQHGKPVYLKWFGKRDPDKGAPMTEDAIFPIHSVTKTITSVAAMMLVDRGKIALDDPVSKYIPSFADMTVGVERKDESGKTVLERIPLRRPMTVEDLLLHTYGFYGDGLVKSAYQGIYLGDFDNAGFAERISKVPLAEQPHTLWDYGHSVDVLGRVIEVASGQSLYRFEKENLLDPLGMTTTKFFLTDPAERARYAQPLPKDRYVERNSLDVTRWESGGGGMVSTIADFARYGQMLLNGGALDGKTYLSPPTFKAMTTDHIGPDAASPATMITILATALASAMDLACAPIPVMRFRHHPARPASSNGMARRASMSWSTRPRTCSSLRCRIRRPAACM